MKLQTNRVLMIGGLVALTGLMWGELFPTKGSLLKEEESKKEVTSTMLKARAAFKGSIDPFRITSYVDPAAKAEGQQMAVQQQEAPVELSLEAILLDGSFRAAVINRQVFLEGETSTLQDNGPQVTVRSVFADRVIVKQGSKELTLPLVTEQTRQPAPRAEKQATQPPQAPPPSKDESQEP